VQVKAQSLHSGLAQVASKVENIGGVVFDVRIRMIAASGSSFARQFNVAEVFSQRDFISRTNVDLR